MKKKVLITDDDELVVLSLEALLTSEGFSVQSAVNGVEAMAKVSQETFDLIVLDVIMPGMTGFEICRAIRQLEGYKAVPIVMLTAKSSEADRQQGLKAGASRFLSKPIDPKQLVVALREELKIQ
ncbi:MAG: response regulator [Myxococcales bacterium]|nr:MAG: response regulator [Myxococcales bacterium]